MTTHKRTRNSKKKSAGDKLERVEFSSRESLRAWLSEKHGQKTSVWGVIWKKSSGDRYVPYDAIVEELLCFGWIDSLPRSLDLERSMLLLSPRKSGSNWSRLNKQRAERMIAEGRMMQAGLRKIDEAKSNGAWTVLDEVDALAEPPDLLKALKGVPHAHSNWSKFPPSTKRGILEWIKNSKTTETRGRRISETADLAGKNIRANQYRQKLPGEGLPIQKRT